MTRRMAIVLALLSACAEKQGVVTSNQDFEGDAMPASLVLTGEDRHEVIDAMRSATAGTPANPLVQPPWLMGWDDVPDAAAAAAVDMEMGVQDSDLDGDVWFFTIRTLDDVPGVLRVEKRPPPECVRVDATVGRFEERTAQAQGLVNAFYRRLKQYGQKWRPQDYGAGTKG